MTNSKYLRGQCVQATLVEQPLFYCVWLGKSLANCNMSTVQGVTIRVTCG